jgi:hypothetical protein
MSNECWRDMIVKEMNAYKDSFDNVTSLIINKPSKSERYSAEWYIENDNPKQTNDMSILDIKFDSGYGGTEGMSFRLYTKTRIYFPIKYDGSEWVESLPIDPNSKEKPFHFGGG